MRLLVAGLTLVWSSSVVFATERVPLPLPRPHQNGVQAMPHLSTRTACQLALAAIAKFQLLPRVSGKGVCGIVDPVLLEAVLLPRGAQIAIDPPAKLRCDMAEAVARWLRDDVVDELAPLGALRGIENYDSYSCRPRNRVAGAKISEHARGNALDIRAVKLASGAIDQLTDPRIDKNARESMRESACKRFHTVLGPGSDGYHESHVHVDLAPRHNGYRICQWAIRSTPSDLSRSAQRGGAHVPMPRVRARRAQTLSERRLADTTR